MSAFDKAFAVVVGHEGGLSLTPQDPGNWTGGACGQGTCRGTKYGISAASYPALDIPALTVADASVIYKRDYWDRVRGDDLPPPLALLVFDAAVNAGPGAATRWLQRAVGTIPDGMIGPATLGAVHAKDGAAVMAEFMAQRLIFMAGLPTWRTFGTGWARRLCRLPYDAVGMGM